MRRIAFISVVLFAGLGVFLWAAQTFSTTWEPLLRQQLEQRLGEALQARVHIESLSLSFIHRLSLKNVEVLETRTTPPTPLFRAQEVSLTFSLIDLPRALYHRDPLETIGLISLESPVITLSPQTFKNRSSRRSSLRSLPPLFTLAWNHGTVQWQEALASGGNLTFRQTQGSFKIRGPKVDFTLRAASDPIPSIRVRASAFSHSWSTYRSLQGYSWSVYSELQGGSIAGVSSLIERWLGHPLLPSGWAAEGQFNLEATCRGRLPISRDHPWMWVQEARLGLENAQIQGPNAAPPVRVHGTLVMKGPEISSAQLLLASGDSHITLSGHVTPFIDPHIDLQASSQDLDLAVLAPSWLSGKSSFEAVVKGPLFNPDVNFQAKIPEGQIARWSFQQASFKILRLQGHWEFPENSVQLGEGTIRLTGVASPDALNLKLVGDGISLKDIPLKAEPLQGSLNFSFNIRGTADHPETVGSFWANSLAWGTPHPESLHGDFQGGDHHFRTEAASDDSACQFSAEGTYSDKDWSLQQATAHLRSGADLSASGSLGLADRVLHGSFHAENLSLAEDIPGVLKRWPAVQGVTDVQANVDGPLTHLTWKATVHGENMTLASQRVTALTATLEGDPQRIQLKSLQAEPGYSGSGFYQWAPRPAWGFQLGFKQAPLGMLTDLLGNTHGTPGTLSGKVAMTSAEILKGNGDLSLNNTGKGALQQAHLRFSLENTHLEVPQFSLQSSQGRAALTGHAFWEKPSQDRPVSRVRFRGDGQASSSDGGALWSLPLQFVGELNPSDAWQGHLELQSKKVQVREKTADPLIVHLHWDPKQLAWDDTRWGTVWTSEGSLRFDKGRTTIDGQLLAHQLVLEPWQYWLWPKTKEPIRGSLTGRLMMTGWVGDPSIQLDAVLSQAVWRAFRFQSTLSGKWRQGALEPLAFSGDLTSGGHFDFRGRITPSQGTAEGTLQLTQFNVHPLGESLSFPQPLQGIAEGTFKVSGPITHLQLAGHLEGGPFTYGAPDAKALHLQNAVMDVSLGPAPDQLNVTRLTINQAVAKTAEEELRTTPGSYVEWGGAAESPLQMGMEIRNLHLGVFTLFGGLDFQGTWQIKPAGFALKGDAYTHSLFINDYELEEGRVHVDYYDRVISFAPPPNRPTLMTGSLDFQKAPQLRFTNFHIFGKDQQGLGIDGDIGPSLWDFKMVGQGMDLGTLGGLAGIPYSLEGTANVAIQGKGDLEKPHVNGQMDVQNGRALGLGFQSGKAAFIWQGTRMTLTQLELSVPDRYTLRGAGFFPLTASSAHPEKSDQSIDFSVRLQDANLGLLKSISSEVKQAKGPVEGLLQITGTLNNPTLRGSVQVHDGDVVGAHYFRHLQNFELAADFTGNDLHISDFRGRSGSGMFQGGGHITFSGFEPQFYDLHLDIPSAKGLDVQVPELAIPESPLANKFHFLTSTSRCDVIGHATFKGPADAPLFTGETELSNGHFSFPPSAKNPPPAAFVDWIRRVTWDAHLKFGEGAWFNNEFVQARVLGALHLQGPSDRLRVDGGLDVGEGTINYLGVNFTIQDAHFDIHSQDNGNTIVNTPYVRGTGESQVQSIDPATNLPIDDTIRLSIDYAPVNEIKPRLVSEADPALPQDKVLAMATQLDVTDLTQQQKNTLYQQQMVRALNTGLAAPLANSLLKKTGLVDQVSVSQKLNPAGPNDLSLLNPTAAQQQQSTVNLLANTKYTLSKNLNNRLSLGYGLRFEPYATPDLQSKLDLRSDVELSYRLLHNFYLKGSFDLPSSNPGSVPENVGTIEHRWRFGWWGNTNPPKPPTAPPPPNTNN